MHGIPTKDFQGEEGLTLVQKELQTFNQGLKLVARPWWLSSKEAREARRHASIILALGIEEEA